MDIARDEGLTVEERDIPVAELKTFDEVLAVGTAVVVTPVGSITQIDPESGVETNYEFGTKNVIGETTKRLYQRVRAIQSGEEEDKFGWNYKINNE
jgi:branched-chain amino acid aminotransferase